uniref:basic salivary proline-rich protein 4-like n=1 Tax=Osmia lignaria TaxID=473952 RepID=UPI00147955B2|nr:basic salivary proline-rich protein 4-like [Osmia lignaria]
MTARKTTLTDIMDEALVIDKNDAKMKKSTPPTKPPVNPLPATPPSPYDYNRTWSEWREPPQQVQPEYPSHPCGSCYTNSAQPAAPPVNTCQSRYTAPLCGAECPHGCAPYMPPQPSWFCGCGHAQRAPPQGPRYHNHYQAHGTQYSGQTNYSNNYSRGPNRRQGPRRPPGNSYPERGRDPPPRLDNRPSRDSTPDRENLNFSRARSPADNRAGAAFTPRRDPQRPQASPQDSYRLLRRESGSAQRN